MLAVLEEMANYDFERIHKVMETLDWKWLDATKREYCIPDVFDLRKTQEARAKQEVNPFGNA